MPPLKLYIAGKVSPESVFGRHDWRDGFSAELSRLSGLEFINLDPTKSQDGFDLDENDSRLIFGRDCFMIKSADWVIVNLTDDISVGGSQEMLIAKYFNKPLIGIAPKGGKFNKAEREILGRTYQDWIHPFVAVPCDVVVEDMQQAADYIKGCVSGTTEPVKNIQLLDDALAYYAGQHHKHDGFLNSLD